MLHKSGINLCLNLNSKHKIKLIGALLLKREQEQDQTLAIFDLTNEEEIKVLNDWNTEHSQAYKLNELLDNEVDSVKSLHKKLESNPKPKIKTILLPTV